jgi:hypothetical protein
MSFWNGFKNLFRAKPNAVNYEIIPVPEIGSEIQIDYSGSPAAVLMSTDDYHLKDFGKAGDGSILWMGSQLRYDYKAEDTIDYIFKFVFNTDGELIDSEIRTLGSRNLIKDGVFQEELGGLREANPIIAPASAVIKTFTVVHEGIEFGLVVRTPEDAEDVWAVEFMPGNTMAFFEPFNSGDYDT